MSRTSSVAPAIWAAADARARAGVATARSARWLTAGLALSLAAAVPARSPAPAATAIPSIYAGVRGSIVLENDRVLVQRFIVQPGQSTGPRNCPAHQLLVVVKGGVLTAKADRRSTLWTDGQVFWQSRAVRDPGSVNTGGTPIEMLWITPRVRPAVRGGSQANPGYLSYPNVPGEDVLENDWLIVQRFKLKPGEWEGVHAHNPDTFYVFIKGGSWLSKSKAHPQGIPGSAEDGAVAWMEPIEPGEGHQSGNVGTRASEVVWVALKR